jgi:hypothetical protein
MCTSYTFEPTWANKIQVGIVSPPVTIRKKKHICRKANDLNQITYCPESGKNAQITERATELTKYWHIEVEICSYVQFLQP